MEPEWWERASNSINETRVSKWGAEDEEDEEERKEKEEGKEKRKEKMPKEEEELSMKRRE